MAKRAPHRAQPSPPPRMRPDNVCFTSPGAFLPRFSPSSIPEGARPNIRFHFALVPRSGPNPGWPRLVVQCKGGGFGGANPGQMASPWAAESSSPLLGATAASAAPFTTPSITGVPEPELTHCCRGQGCMGGARIEKANGSRSADPADRKKSFCCVFFLFGFGGIFSSCFFLTEREREENVLKASLLQLRRSTPESSARVLPVPR